MILHTVELESDDFGDYVDPKNNYEYVCVDGLAEYRDEFTGDYLPERITIVFHTRPGKGRFCLSDPRAPSLDDSFTVQVNGRRRDCFYHAYIDVRDMLAMRKGRQFIYAEIQIPEDEE